MIVGLLLAAGSGRRFGKPKALVDSGDGPWVLRALDTLAAADRRMVVVGAAADEVAALLPEGVGVVRNPDHQAGMGSSLHAGLAALAGDPTVDAALVMLVDLPDVPAAAIDRVMSVATAGPTTAGPTAGPAIASPAPRGQAAGSEPAGPEPAGSEPAGPEPAGSVLARSALARASYRGMPGHPVLIGRDHFAGAMAAAVGDRGARDYLAAAEVTLVECGDLAGGADVDEPG